MSSFKLDATNVTIAIIGVLMTGGASYFSYSLAKTQTQAQLEAKAKIFEDKLSTIENDVSQLQGDVGWMSDNISINSVEIGKLRENIKEK